MDAAAKVFNGLAWLYVVLGVFAAVLVLLTALASGQPEIIAPSIGGVIGLALGVWIAVIIFRATAEIIRLALYIAELLEDIRDK